MQTNIIQIVKFFPPEAEERHFVKWVNEEIKRLVPNEGYTIEFDIGKVHHGINGPRKCVIAKSTFCLQKTP